MENLGMIFVSPGWLVSFTGAVLGWAYNFVLLNVETGVKKLLGR